MQKTKTYRSKKYTNFVDQLPCTVDTNWFIPTMTPGYKGGQMCSGKVTHHHCETGGTSMKGNDLSCIPLCHGHHKSLTTAIHNGKETFAKIYGIYEDKVITQTNWAYIAFLECKLAGKPDTLTRGKK